MKETIKQILQRITENFKEEIFSNQKQFQSAIADLPIEFDAVKIRNLLRIAICDMQVYSKIKNEPYMSKHLIIHNLIRTFSENYNISESDARVVIESIAEFMGYTYLIVTYPYGISEEAKEELAEIEKIIDQYEKRLNDGSISIENNYDKINKLAPNGLLYKKYQENDTEWIEKYYQEYNEISGVNFVADNLFKLKRIKKLYPNEKSIDILGHRVIRIEERLFNIAMKVDAKFGAIPISEDLLNIKINDDNEWKKLFGYGE